MSPKASLNPIALQQSSTMKNFNRNGIIFKNNRLMSANWRENSDVMRKKKKEEFIRTLSQRFENNQKRANSKFEQDRWDVFITSQDPLVQNGIQLSTYNNQQLSRMKFNQTTRNKNTISQRFEVESSKLAFSDVNRDCQTREEKSSLYNRRNHKTIKSSCDANVEVIKSDSPLICWKCLNILSEEEIEMQKMMKSSLYDTNGDFKQSRNGKQI